MPRLRRGTSASRNQPDPVQRQLSPEIRKVDRSRSSSLNNSKSLWRRLRRYWKCLLVIGSAGCVAAVLLAGLEGRQIATEVKKSPSMFRSSGKDVCPAPDSPVWRTLPPDIALSIHVVARGNAGNLRTTLHSLKDACYPEVANLAVSVWALSAHAREVLSAQDDFLWTHGTFQTRTLTTAHGEVPPLEAWARMWTEPTSNEVRLVIPEGLELSKLFHLWLSGTLSRYLGEGVTREEKKIFKENVFGISLSATGLSEVSGKPFSWEAYEVADGGRPIFHTLPGSRGTAFFGWQWGDFATFMDARARILAADSWEGVPLLNMPGRAAVPSWAGSLERFLAEFAHGRGLGILHPNLDGRVSFARRLLPSEEARMEAMESEELEEVESTSAPTLRGTGETETPPERLVRSQQDVTRALKQPSVSTLSAYDLMFQRHPDITHLRLLSYRFTQRLRTSSSRNEDLEILWRRPRMPKPVYSDVKYLIYQPQFGMGNQLRALEAGLAVARVLGRVLVVPDYISDNGEGMWVRYDAIWEFGFLQELVGRDKVILQADFDDKLNSESGGIEPPTKIYVADMPIKQLTGTNEYFSRLGWGKLPQLPLPLSNATEAGWSELVCLEDQVMAISAMFGMFQGWSEESTVGDEHWHRMVKLHVSEEASWLHDFVEDTLARFASNATKASARRGRFGVVEKDAAGKEARHGDEVVETQFMCAHVRRQDFEESCARYEEEYRSGSGREWVVEALAGGGVCWVDENDFRRTLDVYLKRAPSQLGVSPRFVFATSDDARFLGATKFGNAVPVYTLDDVSLPQQAASQNGGGDLMDEKGGLQVVVARQTMTAEEVRAALPAIDVAVCSRAALLVLNYFSTYSALIKSKAKAQPNFVRGLYWADPPALSTWWTTYYGWFSKLFRRSSQ